MGDPSPPLSTLVDTDVIHMIKWTTPPPLVFAHCKWSKTGRWEVLGTRLVKLIVNIFKMITFWWCYLIQLHNLLKRYQLSKKNQRVNEASQQNARNTSSVMPTEVRLANTQPRTVIHESYGVLVKTEANYQNHKGLSQNSMTVSSQLRHGHFPSLPPPSSLTHLHPLSVASWQTSLALWVPSQ